LNLEAVKIGAKISDFSKIFQDTIPHLAAILFRQIL